MLAQPYGTLVGLWSLGLLGLAFLLTGLARRYIRMRRPIPMPLSLLLLVQNQGDALEGFLRTVADLQIRMEGRLASRLVVVDLGSTDDTPRILQRLTREFPALHVLEGGSWDGVGPTGTIINQALTACTTPAVVLLDLRDQMPLHHVLSGLETSLLCSGKVALRR